MSDEQVRSHFQTLRQQIAALHRADAKAWQDVDAAIENLYVIYEQIQTSLEATEVLGEELLLTNQQLTERYQHYYDLFQSSPIAYLVTDPNGVILEANYAIAELLNVPQRFLVGKPLAVYVAELDRPDFRTKLNQLSLSHALQVWRMKFCPREDIPFAAELHLNAVRTDAGAIKYLQIGIYNLSRFQNAVAQPSQPLDAAAIPAAETTPLSSLPQALDGLRVLVVDDEMDVREFITAILESYGVGVRAVASAAAALEELAQFRPDVLVSDVRMPGEDGYSLIRRIRALEAEQGGHLPAAAITAYLEEDREKSLSAGYEAHLHKLAQPSELIQLVAQLAGRTAS